jgi:hypothetical protein
MSNGQRRRVATGVTRAVRRLLPGRRSIEVAPGSHRVGDPRPLTPDEVESTVVGGGRKRFLLTLKPGEFLRRVR